MFVRGNLISWNSKKQSVVSQSSSEFEYKTMTQYALKIMWLHQLLVEVGIKTLIPANLWCDKQAALILPIILFSMNELNT